MSNAGLYIGLSGILAQSQGLDVVSQNVANADTPGYTRETTNMTAVVQPGSAIGSGVAVSSISQVTDNFLQTQAYSASADASSSTSYLATLNSAQTNFQEPSPVGINEQLSALWNSFDQVANHPDQSAGRQQLVGIAQQLTTTLNSDSQGLTNVYNSTTSAVSETVTSLNQQLATVATLNGQITSVLGQNGANTLIDQRNQILNSISNEIGARITNNPDGSVTVLSGGVTLVTGTTAETLSVHAPTAPPIPAPGGAVASIVSNSTGTTLPITTGSLGGQLQALNGPLPSYATSLDAFANSFATQVNNILTNGYVYQPYNPTPPPTPPPNGLPLFLSSATGQPITAANITINSQILSNPFNIAAAQNYNQPLDGTNAQAVAALGSLPNPPDAQYTAIVSQVGLDVSTSQANANAQTTRAQSATASLASVSGVNTNQEMVNMLAYQQAYQASAKVISTISTAVQSLLAAI